MPSSWHQSQEGIHQGQEALSHVFSPVPGALSCDQDQAPSLNTGADPPSPSEGCAQLGQAEQPPWVWDLPEGTAPTMKV